MGVFVIVCYRPFKNKAKQLLEAVKDHIPVLRAEGLVTDRPPYVMRAKDGAIVEVFEWKSQAAIDEAHSNASVARLWERFGACCEYQAIGQLAEASSLFSAFEPINL
jgi:hypothetical protein